MDKKGGTSCEMTKGFDSHLRNTGLPVISEYANANTSFAEEVKNVLDSSWKCSFMFLLSS